MPSALGGIMGAIKPLMSMIGPLGTALGIAGAPATGGASLLAALPSVASTGMGLAQNFMGQQQPTLPSIKAPALTAAPIGPVATPDIPTPAGGGLSLAVPGAGASPSSGAGSAAGGDIANLIAQALGTGGGGSPFAAFGG